MQIFVTGSASFVGRALIARCEIEGIACTGIDAAAPASGSSRPMDIRAADVADAIPDQVDAVVHLAALSRDKDCVNNAHECFDVNVMGTLNVMRAAEARRARQFIFASTEWVYDRFDGDGARDEESIIDIRNLSSEYALSKLVAENALRQRYARGFCATTILRFGIIYGPRIANWSAVESLMSAVRSGGPVRVGNPGTARRFIHVDDVARGVVKAVGLTGFHIINLQGPRLVTLAEVIEAAGRVLGVAPTIASDGAPASIRNVSNDRSRELLDWEPAIDVKDGLRTLIPLP